MGPDLPAIGKQAQDAVGMAVTNLAQQDRKRHGRGHRHPCRPVAGPHHRCRSPGHPPRLGASTELRHIAPVAIFPDRWPV